MIQRSIEIQTRSRGQANGSAGFGKRIKFRPENDARSVRLDDPYQLIRERKNKVRRKFR
jgi:hypothetical protein